MDITLHGGASWLYQIFVDIFMSEIESAAASAMESEITTEVNTVANQELATLPVNVTIQSDVLVDFSLMPAFPPNFVASQYIETHHTGEFYDIKNSTEAPFKAPALPNIVPTKMAGIQVSEFLINSGGFVFYELGEIAASIYPNEIPSDFPFQLNTSSFCVLISALCKSYPNDAMMIDFSATQYPNVQINTTGALATLYANAGFNIYYAKNKTKTPVFTIGLIGYASGVAMISGSNLLTGKLTYLSSNISLVSSQIGKIDVKLFQKVVDALLGGLVIKELNTIFAKGLAIPVVDGVSFVDPVIDYGLDYLYVSSNLLYKPTFRPRF